LELRDYQQKALDGIHTEFKSNDSTLLVLPTGTGKTVVFSHLTRDYVDKGRVMLLAHREELVNQGWRHLRDITSLEPDIEMADYRVNEFSQFKSDIVVGSIQTQVSGRRGYERMQKFDPNEFSLLIIDEAHHSAAKSYRKVIDYYRRNKNLKVLGATATPDRADEKALGQIFDSVAFDYEIVDAIDDGWLVPITQQSVVVDGLDYSGIRTTAGDLNGKDLAAVLEFEETLHGFVGPILELSGDRKTLIFAASIAHAERICEILNRHKPKSAEWVHGKTPKEERRDLWPRYAGSDFQYLVNVGVTTEGFDEPSIEIIAICRPTKSRALFGQMIGRGTRTLPKVVDDCAGAEARKLAIAASAKPCVEILDFVGNAGRHKLITPSDILGGKYEDDVIDWAKQLAIKESAGKPVDVAEALEKAERQVALLKQQEAERKRRKQLTFKAKYSTAKVNPFTVLDMTPWRERAWHKDRPPSDKQVALLEKMGVDIKGLSFTHASQIIGRLIQRRKEDKASYKMVKVLQRAGYENAEDMSVAEAKEQIGVLANNNWKRPARQIAAR
jgi:superfamily II DNA or RNA helicase